MFKKINKRRAVPAFLILSFLLIFSTRLRGQESESWLILLSKSLQADQAIKVVLNDLQEAGLNFTLKEDTLPLAKNSLVIGSQDRNRLTTKLVQKNRIELHQLNEMQGYEIITKKIDGNRVLIVSGGSILGEVYGLYWIRDRLKVLSTLPDINVKRIPDLTIRFTNGGNKEEIKNALRYGATWVWGGPSVNQLVPWNFEPEQSENEKYRAEIKELINYAHSLHLKFFVFEDEFSYHPSLLDEFGAQPSPSDPAFWDAVQAKYRRLFQVLPEIDGVRIRTGESTRVGGNFKALDVMHDGENCDWSLAKRYRTYVKKMYNVVVGEFDKIYFQRTWVTSAHEQHSMAAVYKEIFTEDIPVKNLYLSPYLSTTDRYFYQPYNPTFNLTPHNMIVLLATLDYHSQAGVNTFPTFPGQYFQGGLKTIFLPPKSNCQGVDFGVPPADGWDTRTVTAYTVYRLSWNVNEDMKTIASDFAAQFFGSEAAATIGKLLLLSPHVYKYGIYIEPVAYGDFRSLPHLRLTTFEVHGFPQLDSGKEHINFLERLYWRCQPWKTETLLYLDYGLSLADSMVKKIQKIQPQLSDLKSAEQVENSVDLTYWLIKTNNLYVKTFFAYFDYRQAPTQENKNLLIEYEHELRDSMKKFRANPDCAYRLDGMEQLLINVDQVLTDLRSAEAKLAKAPDENGIKQLIFEHQQKSAQLLDKYSQQATKFLSWQGRVDGMDLLHIKADKLAVEHLRYDNISEMNFQFFKPLPQKHVTVVVKDIQARSYRPFILAQPNRENDYQVTVYLSDFPMSGYSWWKFELYYIPKSPEELGLFVPWN